VKKTVWAVGSRLLIDIVDFQRGRRSWVVGYCVCTYGMMYCICIGLVVLGRVIVLLLYCWELLWRIEFLDLYVAADVWVCFGLGI